MRASRRAWLGMAASAGWAAAHAAPAPADVLHDLAPTGAVRAAINFGNPVLSSRDPATGAPGGVSVALARELGRQLGVPVTLVPFQEAGQVSSAARSGVWDIAFLAIDPVRGADIAFTAPYAMIEGCYLVQAGSALRRAGEVDREGVRVAVAAGSAYDLFLTRALQHAALVRRPASDAAVDAFAAGQADVLAGVRQPLVKLAASHPDWRLLDGRFMAINQAMCTPQGHPAGAAFLNEFVASAKASGFVAAALRADGHDDVTVPDA